MLCILSNSSHIGELERKATDQAVGLQTAFGGKEADTVLIALHDRLVIHVAISEGEIAGCEHAEFVAICTFQHDAEFRA